MLKTKSRGRPRQFNEKVALEKAIYVFFEKGYDGASLDDLTQAMGISRPSLYASFGNKEALFLKVLNTYSNLALEQLRALLFQAATAQEGLKQMFDHLVASQLSESNQCQSQMGGCLLVNSTVLACRESKVGEELARLHTLTEELLKERLDLGQAQGDLPAQTDTLALAQYFNGITQGMAVLARSLQSPEAVRNMARIALAVLPKIS